MTLFLFISSLIFFLPTCFFFVFFYVDRCMILNFGWWAKCVSKCRSFMRIWLYRIFSRNCFTSKRRVCLAGIDLRSIQVRYLLSWQFLTNLRYFFHCSIGLVVVFGVFCFLFFVFCFFYLIFFAQECFCPQYWHTYMLLIIFYSLFITAKAAAAATSKVGDDSTGTDTVPARWVKRYNKKIHSWMNRGKQEKRPKKW